MLIKLSNPVAIKALIKLAHNTLQIQCATVKASAQQPAEAIMASFNPRPRVAGDASSFKHCQYSYLEHRFREPFRRRGLVEALRRLADTNYNTRYSFAVARTAWA